MKAVILAAGFGTRLWPLTIGRTKPAIPFLNRPLINYTIDYLRRYGIEELIINLHHEPESVIEQIGDGSRYGVKINYSLEEPEILGTSGALDRVRHLLREDTFIVINGKIITDIDLNLALATHRNRKAIATLVLRSNAKHEYFREIEISEEGRIAGFGDFPDRKAAAIRNPPLMFTGIHILEPAILDYIPQGVFSDSVKDVYPKAMAEGEFLAAHIGEGSWFELSTLERYLTISLEFSQRDERSTSLAPGGLVMGEGCIIEPGAIVERSIMWKGVRIERGAIVTECIIADNVVIPKGAAFYRAAIVRADLAANTERPEKAANGELIGDNLVVHFR
jgi:mannose-1-phosphate guanylyltransferase / phosphomannomutase